MAKRTGESSFLRLCDAVFVHGHALDFKIDGHGSEGNSRTMDRKLVTLCSEFLNGGTNTTEIVIEWGWQN
ncbi:cytochrome P450 77A3-like [Cucumis melo var. makuwa]|uniref:Cytochrome P450 77A3-like n=2 Tax=Cucumis melo TaxID=3656 RepID=A0A5D3BI24_CUCMM|nr:cytochrome P450 77A3-like [Cucumis melo var. makuwa]TYJ98726.1 cytochrome P450 77A3-like [Cucumis melo var. makuwa]